MAEDIVQRGLEAYEAGDRKTAHQLLAEAVRGPGRTDPRAWYTMAQLQRDPAKRERCLQTVLKLEPDHQAAQTELAALQRAEAVNDAEPSAQPTETVEKPGNVTEIPKRRSRSEGAAATGTSLPLLTAIPGAPAKISLDGLSATLQELAKTSLGVFLNRNSPAESMASWWRVWLLAVSVGLITGLLTIIARIIIAIRFETFPNIFGLITTPLLLALIGALGLGVGAFLSHWYLTKQAGGSGKLLDHCYTVALVWAPAAVISGLLIVVETLFGARVFTLRDFLLNFIPNLAGDAWAVTLAALVLTGYTLYLLSKHLRRVHQLEGRALWIGGVIALAVIAFVF